VKFKFAHFNFNVLDLQKSIQFYQDALGLTVKRSKEAADGSYIITFLEDRESDFYLELTWLKDHTEPYDLGEQEYHLAFITDQYDAAHTHHQEMGVICYENPAMGIYFILDPDGYWIEIIPAKR
jgi:lactoylglutathione lyase